MTYESLKFKCPGHGSHRWFGDIACHNFRGRGFTLVELLVVVAIMSLLIAILLPSLAKARAAAQTTVCLTRLRQVDVGLLAYAGENFGFVLYSTQNDDVAGTSAWVPAWYTYFYTTLNFSGPNSMKCPSGGTSDRLYVPTDNGYNHYWSTPSGPSWAEKTYGTNYGANSGIMPRNDKWQVAAKQGNILKLRYLDKVFAMSEVSGEFLGGWAPGSGIVFRHGTAKDAINLNFWDGHCESWSEQDATGRLIEITSYGNQPWQDGK